MLLIDYARDVVGLPMRGLAQQTHIGWTTDAAKAETVREAGARVQPIHNGYDVSFAVGAEMVEAIAA